MLSLTDAGPGLQHQRKVVLVVDLVDSVRLMQADELGVIRRWQDFLAQVHQAILPAQQGRLVQIDGQSVAGAANPQAEPRVQFDGGTQRMSGSGGCNAISGNYRRSGSVLRIGPVMSTRRACADPGLNALETRFVAVLESTAGFNV